MVAKYLPTIRNSHRVRGDTGGVREKIEGVGWWWKCQSNGEPSENSSNIYIKYTLISIFSLAHHSYATKPAVHAADQPAGLLGCH